MQDFLMGVFVYKFIAVISAILFSTVCLAMPMWHCAATSDSGAVWHWFGDTQAETRNVVEKQCEAANHHKYCGIVCFPPKNYWRCLSHDTPPAIVDSKNPIKPKLGTWFWTSSEGRQIAINGARDACRHNSLYGGCYVNPDACSSSTPGEK